jgi:hypothetical protein
MPSVAGNVEFYIDVKSLNFRLLYVQCPVQGWFERVTF